jgi:translation initiation factor 1
MTERVVYSTGVGRRCADCGRAVEACTCRRGGARVDPAARRAGAAAAASQPKGAKDGVVRVGRETQGRSGKGVTVITGLPLAPPELDKLARELKQRCGSGGTVREGVVEIQGEHRDTLVAELTKRGYIVKRSGG